MSDASTALQLIAKVVHEVNRAACEAAGDMSQVPWDQASDDAHRSTLRSVHFVLENPDATPASQWAQWKEGKITQGWVYGPVKNADAKTHPCLVDDYTQVPYQDRIKDDLVNAVVNAMRHTVA